MSISPSQLAINGGPKAVKTPYRDRWRAVHWLDAIPLLKAIYRGQITAPTGKGAVERFEADFAQLTQTKFALAMNSGTAALHSALFAVGVGLSDEVIVPSHTWHATASAVLCCGAKPIFCDVDRNTLTMDPQDVLRKITKKTKAILPVHVWGNPCPMDQLMKIAQEQRLKVVEDCSHAHGASYKGKAVGSWGDVGCFSLQGSKAVSAGEGGIAVCSDPVYYDRMLALGHPLRTEAGMKSGSVNIGRINLGPKYRPHLMGILLAASSLKRLSKLNQLRQRNWKIFCDLLSTNDLVKPISSHPDARMGGFLEFKFILNADKMSGGLEAFVKAAQAEGIPVTNERYGFLHEVKAFASDGVISLDLLSKNETAAVENSLPNVESLRGRLITLAPLTDVSEAFVKQCAVGLMKVASILTAASHGK